MCKSSPALVPSMLCRSALLFLVIAAQAALLYWAHSAMKVMRDEWPHVVKASPARVYVIQHEHFWGPVNAIVPKSCREMGKWQAIADMEDEAQAPMPASPHFEPTAGAWTTPTPSDGVAHAVEGPGQPPQLLGTASTTAWQDSWQQSVPAPASPSFLQAGAAPEGPGWSSQIPSLESSTTAWMSTVPGLTPMWLQPAPPGVSTTSMVQTSQRLMLMAAKSTDLATMRALQAAGKDVLHEDAASIVARHLAAGDDDVIDGGDIVLHRCNETMHFKGVSHLHRYLSMISLSNHITGGTQTAQELHKARIRGHDHLLYAIVICMILKYSLKITDICAECWGHQYVQLWNQGRTTFDKALESLLLHGVSIIFTLAMQMTLCGLFLTFWREDHFIMTYIPGLGFSLFFGSLVAFCVFMVVDRLRGWMARCRNSYIYCFWFIWLMWMVLLTVPMIGYCIYSVQFMWRVRQMGWLQDQDQIFSKEFVHASVTAARATGGFVLVAVVDLVVILLLDLDQSQAQNGNTN